MSVVKLNEHPVTAGLEGQWEKIAMMIMHAAGMKEFKLTSELIQSFMQAYAPGMPCLVAEGIGRTGEEGIRIRLMNETDARQLMAEKRQAQA